MTKRSKCLLSVEEIIERYENGESSEKIALDAGVSSRQIRRILVANGVETRKLDRYRKYNVNQDFFKTWTPEMAYVLGFVITDGCIVNKNSFSISQKDKEILEKIAKAMNSEHPIGKRKNNEDDHIHYLNINSQKIVTDLNNLGVYPNNSLTMEMPNVPEEYFYHFFRGVFDANGWIQETAYTARLTSGSESFAIAITDKLLNYGYNVRLEKTNVQRKSPVYRIVISGKQDIKDLADEMYKDCGQLFIPRKRITFEKWKD